ncbi:L-xylulose reductase isoform X2 [Hydra vulgaris]|uniref:L-xylulose reductase isoform X2 n=1 Tax=Hydra vulgaris TaxID=6087 RepID=A0ABM4CDR8_HYDVU
MIYNFSGKKVLVTGAGKGIGRGICIAMLKAGAQVFALSRTQSDLDSLHQEFSEVVTICVDLNDMEKVKEKLDIIPEDITLLVNNAGCAKLQHFLDITEEAYDSIMNINLKSMVFISQFIAKKMISYGKGGKIVNVSSQSSLTALPLHTVYCVSKAGVDHLTRCMALELGPHHINVNAINPTVVMTDMGKKAWSEPSVGDPMKNQIPLGKFAEVEDVVNTVLFLLSDESSMISGVVLPIDGGFLASRKLN